MVWGYDGENNSADLKIKLPDFMVGEKFNYTVHFKDAFNKESSVGATATDGVCSVLLTKSLAVGGRLKVQVVGVSPKTATTGVYKVKAPKSAEKIRLVIGSQTITLAKNDSRVLYRLLLDKIDFKRGMLCYGGKEYKMLDSEFPTIDPNDPYRLTAEECDLVEKLHNSFTHSEKLRKHIRCFMTEGSMYLVCNNNLLFHASIPLNADGSFKEVTILGEKFAGKRLLDRVDQLVRAAFFDDNNDTTSFALDYLWYLWCGPDSPLFDKDKMATFERYFIADKELHKEEKGAYYTLRDREDICNKILQEFGIDNPHSHIINGHVPVKTIKGEQPVKANGKMLVIDGGFSRAYQPETGIAGYTLVFHSRALQLVQHEPFESRQKAIEEGLDIKSNSFLVEFNSQRMLVKDTDKGKVLRKQIDELKQLLAAYRLGVVKERN